MDFSGRHAIPQRIIQEKVMQNIRAHCLLCLLRDRAVLIGRQQFRTDRRVNNILDDRFHPGETILIHIVPHLVNQCAHQRFGYACVDRIHAHMVAIVGAPAKCKL